MGAELATRCVPGGGPDVVLLPWGINSITHTAGGGKRGERKGEENEWVRNNGKQEAETLQHNARRVSCRLRQIRSNTLFKAVFSPPNVSRSLKPHLTMVVKFFCTTAAILWSIKCALWALKFEQKIEIKATISPLCLYCKQVSFIRELHTVRQWCYYYRYENVGPPYKDRGQA